MQITDFWNTTENEILHNDNVEYDSQSSNKENYLLSYSCYDMDSDKKEEHTLKILYQQNAGFWAVGALDFRFLGVLGFWFWKGPLLN